MTHDGLVYINAGQKYYARWSRKDRKRTHGFISEEPLTPYWIEVLRATPELLDKEKE